MDYKRYKCLKIETVENGYIVSPHNYSNTGLSSGIYVAETITELEELISNLIAPYGEDRIELSNVMQGNNVEKSILFGER